MAVRARDGPSRFNNARDILDPELNPKAPCTYNVYSYKPLNTSQTLNPKPQTLGPNP